MRIVSVVGARPQFIKAAPVCRALRAAGHDEVLVHSGQHFDHAMSQVFFDELGIPAPDHNLGVAGGSHGAMTGQMLELLERLFVEVAPDTVLVYGDTNTTLAAGLAAAKIHIPVAHVEAGLRSFNRAMPEEINRVLTDHLSELLFCPTEIAVANLAAEGITDGVHQVGDVMLDAARHHAEHADPAKAAARYGLTPGGYYLATVHRAATADDPVALAGVVEAFASLDLPVLWPVHPRTRKALESGGLASRDAVGSAHPPRPPRMGRVSSAAAAPRRLHSRVGPVLPPEADQRLGFDDLLAVAAVVRQRDVADGRAVLVPPLGGPHVHAHKHITPLPRLLAYNTKV